MTLRSIVRAIGGRLLKRTSYFPFNYAAPMDAVGVGLSEPYKQSVWVSRAIKKVALPIASVPLCWYGQDGDEFEGGQEWESFWESPFAGYRTEDAILASVGWLKLKGEVFWLLGDDWLVPFQEQGLASRRIMIAAPDRMQPIRKGGSGADVDGWSLTTSAGKSFALLPEQVIHIKNWNPYDPLRGLSEYDAAATATEADFAAGRFNRDLMAANGDTGPIVTGSGITQEQADSIKAMLRAKRDAQRRGEFRPLFIPSDIKVEDSKLSVPDTTFIANRLANRHEIFLAFGVPPSMADKMESYSIGSASDWFLLISETCIPTSCQLASAFTAIGRRIMPTAGLTAQYDWDEHPTMQAVRRERMASADSLWNKGMPMQLVSDYLGLGLPEFPGWEVGYLPFSASPVGAPEEPSSAPPAQPSAEPETPPANDTEDNLDDGNDNEQEDKAVSAIKEAFANPTSRATAKEAAQWRALMAKRSSSIKSYRSKLTRIIMDARSEVLRKLESGLASGAQPTTRGADQFLFDLAKFDQKFKATVKTMSLDNLSVAGQQLFEEVGLRDPWTAPPEEALRFVQQRQNLLTDVPQSVFDDIKGTIEGGMESGDSLKEIADAVRGRFNSISAERADTIARTETHTAFSRARQDAMVAARVPYKRWLASNDGDVRDAHLEANGQTVPVTDPFILGAKGLSIAEAGQTETLMEPGDPSASGANTINCRCAAVAVLEPEE